MYCRKYLFPPLVLVFLLFNSNLYAAHESSEHYDGTVNSFHWLKKPLNVADAAIHDENGNRFTLSDFKNRIVLLNFWASWCAPCIRELPKLDRLQQRLGGDDFVVVSVSLDENIEPAREMFFDQIQIKHLQLYLEPATQLGKFFPVDVIPVNFIIDRNGQATGLLRSYVDWDNPLSDTLIKHLIAGAPINTLNAK